MIRAIVCASQENLSIMKAVLLHSIPRMRHLGVSLLALAAGIFVPSSIQAQAPTGLIGARYAGVSLFFENIREEGIDDGWGIAVRANLPLHAAIDLSISGVQEEIDTNRFRERNAFATLTAHWAFKDLTPFVSGSVGQVWQSAVVDGVKYSDDEPIYAVSAGVEAPIADRTAFDLRVTYHKYFSGDLGDYWITSAGLNHWLTDRVAVTGSVGFREGDSTIFSLGGVVRF
jgi:hypothetical protein